MTITRSILSMTLAGALLSALLPASRAAEPAEPAPPPWPKGYHVEMTITVAKTRWQPPMVVWIEDANGKYLTTLAVWSKKQNMKHLKTWWALTGGDAKPFAPVTSATRRAGVHQLVWDGLDKDKKPVPAGSYVVRIENTLEGKKNYNLKGPLLCADQPATAAVEIPEGSKIDSVASHYGPPPAKEEPPPGEYP
ncbi:MAG: DUF2271 domain-containing protein [Planctomycetota bacterium]|nr:DUF2271 domain-containing protein [Planctomycetota bacterium]